MALFQQAPDPEEPAQGDRPLDLSPEEVGRLDEAEWYARALQSDARQLTLRALLTGTVVGLLLSFASVYTSLTLGVASTVTITACIGCFGLWGGLRALGLARGPMTLLETSSAQSTASSAGYATSIIAGTAAPAMLSLSERNLPWYVLAPWILCCAGLGVMMAIPMKRGMINRERLPFPTGTAAASLLKSLYGTAREARILGRALLAACVPGAVLPLLRDAKVSHHCAPKEARCALLPSELKVFDWLPSRQVRMLDPTTHELTDALLAPSRWHMTMNNSVLVLAAGAMVGLRVALSAAFGSLVTVYLLGPIALGWTDAGGKVVAAIPKPESLAGIGTWFGAPLLVSYGLVSFALQFRTMGRAIRSLTLGPTGAAAERVAETEVPLQWFLVGTAAFAVPLIALAYAFFRIPVHYAALAVVMSFALALVVCRATGETDIAPAGPIGKIMQLTFGTLIPQNNQANLMTASISAGAAQASSDLLTDLKSGYLLGANPRRQFVAQFTGIFAGTVGTCIAYYALVPDVSAIKGDHAAFEAPAARNWIAVAELFKTGMANLHPLARQGIAVGLLAGLVFALLEWAWPKSKRFMPSPTGLGLGLLLSFSISSSLLLGALAAAAYRALDAERAERFVVPIASGLIAGEGIVAVVVALLNGAVFR
jgi:uncharacterized oligopeptide transporter (OPT) family protein